MEKVDTVAFPVVLSANPWAQGVRDLVKRGLEVSASASLDGLNDHVFLESMIIDRG